MADEPSGDDRQSEEPRAPSQDKADPRARPDRPTPSDDATLVERDEGAHAEFIDTPSMEDPEDRDRSRRPGRESRG